MAQPVWVLSVDLQTKTATFQSGMADAAKSARGAFTDIKNGAGEMGGHIQTNMFASRHAIMAVSEAFGDTMPRAITALLVHIGPLGAALEAAFPYAAIGLAVVLILKHLNSLKEAGIQLTEDQLKFKTAAENVFNSLDEKLLQSGIRMDELKNDHLGALAKQLELIDKQSMAELAQQFGVLAKAADVVMKELEGHWYTFGIGSDGAKHALTEFQNQYESLLAHGKDKEASDLLAGTRESAEHVLALQRQATQAHDNLNTGKGSGTQSDNRTAYYTAINALQKAGVGITQDEVKAQQQLVDALTSQETIQAKVAALKKSDSSNATATTAGQQSAEAAQAAKAAADSRMRISESGLAADRATANAQMDILRTSIAERTATELAFAGRELAIRLKGNTDEIAALDKMSKDYPNALKALHEKTAEIEAAAAAEVSGIKAKASVAQNAQDLANTEEGFRAAVDATQEGMAARLAAIDAALKSEQALNMQDLRSYREFLTQRVITVRQMALEESKLQAEAGKEAAENDEKMGSLALAALREHLALIDSARRVTIQMQMREEIQAADAEFTLKLTAMEKEAAALDKSNKDYTNKLKAAQDQQRQLVQQHENEITAIKDKAEIARNSRILSADERFNDAIASGLTQTLMGHKTFAAMITSFGDQAASGMMQNAIKSIIANDYTKESDAAKAARAAFNIGLEYGGPAGFVLGPIFAAAVFAEQMAFADGGIVPGVGRGDIVPAMLTPGEGIVPGGVMDKIRTMANSGGMQSAGTTVHLHHSPTYHIQTIDGDGIKGVLAKHGDEFTRHAESQLRRMNR